MTRLTEEQITQKAREAVAAQYTRADTKKATLAGDYDGITEVKAARAAIIATLTEYAPHLLPPDPDEELATKLVAQFHFNGFVGGQVTTQEQLALYVIKHMRESGK